MGMTIDEAIEKYKKLSEEAENNAVSYAHLEEFKRELKHNTEARYCALSKEECLASATEYRQLTEWLRKYQRIQAIVKEWREVGLDYDSCDAMDNIERVIEDGSDKRL